MTINSILDIKVFNNLAHYLDKADIQSMAKVSRAFRKFILDRENFLASSFSQLSLTEKKTPMEVDSGETDSEEYEDEEDWFIEMPELLQEFFPIPEASPFFPEEDMANINDKSQMLDLFQIAHSSSIKGIKDERKFIALRLVMSCGEISYDDVFVFTQKPFRAGIRTSVNENDQRIDRIRYELNLIQDEKKKEESEKLLAACETIRDTYLIPLREWRIGSTQPGLYSGPPLFSKSCLYFLPDWLTDWNSEHITWFKRLQTGERLRVLENFPNRDPQDRPNIFARLWQPN